MARTRGAGAAVALMAVVASLCTSGAAHAASVLQYAGAPLAGASVPTTATVEVVGLPAGSVSWVLDGRYLGRDTAAPFELTLRTTAGQHKLKARAETVSGVKTTHEVRFTAVTPAPASAPEPAPAPAPAPPPTTSPVQPSTVSTVRTGAELTAALSAAAPGQVIQLADGVYKGRFVASTSGTAAAPVVLRGGRGAVLDGGDVKKGYALHLSGANHWRLQGFTVRGAQKGLVLDRSSNNVITGLDIGFMGMEAVHFRTASSHNRLEDSDVHDTGLYVGGYGEGVYIGSAKSNWSKYGGGGPDRSDRNVVIRNRIWATTAENVDVKEGTTGGVLRDNWFDGSGITGEHYGDSWIDLKGNGYLVAGNTGVNAPRDGFQTHVQLSGWGRDNVFSANTLTVNASGYGIDVYSPATTGNVVRCDNAVQGAARGLSNIACR